MLAKIRLGTKFVFALLVALAIGSYPTAHAGNQALLELLKVLRDDGTISQQAYEALQKAALVEDKQQEASSVAATAQPDSEKGVEISFKGDGLKFESKSGEFAFRLGGRLMFDAARYNDDKSELGSGTEVRRARLSWKGTLWNDWGFSASVEFATDGAELRSTYIDYTGFSPTRLRFGNFKEPFSLEELSSSKYTTFMERAMLTEFAPGRNIGLGVYTRGDDWTVNAGTFAEGGSDEGEQDEGLALTGRTTFAPVHTDDRAVHLGAAASIRRPGDDDTIRIRARPESHVTDVRLVDTGTIEKVDTIFRLGLEAAASFGPLSLQSEYIVTELERDNGLPDLKFDGWYAYASWFLTGETRPYRVKDGFFGRVIPKGIIGRGGGGAWEIGVRYSNIDLTDEDVIGGAEDNLTLGLNWYATPNIRFMANYVRVLDLNRSADAADNDEPSVFQIRGQADF